MGGGSGDRGITRERIYATSWLSTLQGDPPQQPGHEHIRGTPEPQPQCPLRNGHRDASLEGSAEGRHGPWWWVRNGGKAHRAALDQRGQTFSWPSVGGDVQQGGDRNSGSVVDCGTSQGPGEAPAPSRPGPAVGDWPRDCSPSSQEAAAFSGGGGPAACDGTLRGRPSERSEREQTRRVLLPCLADSDKGAE